MKFKKMLTLALIIFTFITAASISQSPARKYNQLMPNYKSLKDEIYTYLSNQEGTYGLYFIDLNSGKDFGYNELAPFHAASTFKVPMNLYLYQEAFKGNLNLKERLVYLDKHREGGTGIMKNNSPGDSYYIDQLAEYSIIHSDNIATNILLERLVKKNVKELMRVMGGQVVDDDQNITCPYDLAIYMREVLNFSNEPEGEILLNNLYNAEFKDRIPAPLPQDVKIANKIGTWPPTHTYNDVAYVEHPTRPYILAITCKDTPGYGETLPIIHQLSKIIYEYQNVPPVLQNKEH